MLLISKIFNFFPRYALQCFYICMAIQQKGTYHDALEKTINFL